jgi:hypothetical protein
MPLIILSSCHLVSLSHELVEATMRVEFKIEGGLASFPGLSKPRVIDSADLSTAEAERLRRLVDAAGIFELPASGRALPKGAADYRQYTITVEDGRRRTVRLADPIDNPDLEALVEYLQAKTRPGDEPTSKGE